MTMKMTTKIFTAELVGEMIEVIDAKNKNNQGMKGKIVDETKMTITIQQNGKIKILLKSGIVFRLSRNSLIIKGTEIMKRPEERIKG